MLMIIILIVVVLVLAEIIFCHRFSTDDEREDNRHLFWKVVIVVIVVATLGYLFMSNCRHVHQDSSEHAARSETGSSGSTLPFKHDYNSFVQQQQNQFQANLASLAQQGHH